MNIKMLGSQNAADLEFPANAPARAEFKLDSFPPTPPATTPKP